MYKAPEWSSCILAEIRKSANRAGGIAPRPRVCYGTEGSCKKDRIMAFDIAADLKRYEDAVAYYQTILRMETRFRKEKGRDARKTLTMLEHLVSPGIYEHYRSTPEKQKLYVVQWIAQIYKNGPFVVNLSRYVSGRPERPEPRLLVGENSFLFPVKDELGDPPYVGPRFRLVRECTCEEAQMLFLS